MGDTFYRDVIVPGVSEQQYPSVAFHTESIGMAGDSGVYPTSQTLDNRLRFWAKKPPDRPLKATVALMGCAGKYVLPIATAKILGGVRIGEGLSITEDGLLSVDAEIPENCLTIEQFQNVLQNYPTVREVEELIEQYTIQGGMTGASDAQIDGLF